MKKVEVFSAFCPFCEPATDMVKELVGDSCDVVIYDVRPDMITDQCRELMKLYRIEHIPSVVVDGRLLECFKSGLLSEKELMDAVNERS